MSKQNRDLIGAVLAIIILLVIGFVIAYHKNDKWTGFYYTSTSQNPTLVGVTPKYQSNIGQFASLSACKNWAIAVRSTIRPMGTDMGLCVQKCRKHLFSSNIDCSFSSGVRFSIEN